MKDCMRRRKGLNSAAITRVEATTARVDSLAGKGDEEPLQHDDTAEVKRNQYDSQGAVDEGAVDEEVYIVEAVA